jgi:hypothetical protein
VWNSAIVADFPKLFEDFKQKRFTLLWRGSRDGFGGSANRGLSSSLSNQKSRLTFIDRLFRCSKGKRLK